MYKKIEQLCIYEGISVAQLCKNIGIRQSVLSELKQGRSKSLSQANTKKVADYFGVTIDYLLGNESHRYVVNADLLRLRKLLGNDFRIITSSGWCQLGKELKSGYLILVSGVSSDNISFEGTVFVEYGYLSIDSDTDITTIQSLQDKINEFTEIYQDAPIPTEPDDTTKQINSLTNRIIATDLNLDISIHGRRSPESEKELLLFFERLNSEGQVKVIQYAKDLTAISKYVDDTASE